MVCVLKGFTVNGFRFLAQKENIIKLQVNLLAKKLSIDMQNVLVTQDEGWKRDPAFLALRVLRVFRVFRVFQVVPEVQADLLV